MAQIKELSNNISVVGTLKTNDLVKEEVTDRVTGQLKTIIRGNIVIEVAGKDGKVHNIRLDAYTTQFTKAGKENKMFKGLETVINEYKDLDFYPNEADRVRALGNISVNDYVREGDEDVTTNNRFRLNSVRRLKGEQEDEAYASVDAVFMGSKETNDENKLSMKLFTVGYNGTFIPLQDAVITPEMFAQFETIYYPGAHGVLTLKLNNYAEQSAPTESESQGFGIQKDLVAQKFVRNLEVVGGGVPSTNEIPEEDIKEALEGRKKYLSELVAKSALTAQQGFGAPQQGFGNATAQAQKPKQEQASSPWESNSTADTEVHNAQALDSIF